MKVLKRLRRDAPPEAELPPAPDQPLLAVGDIHGRLDLLDRLLTRLDSPDGQWLTAFPLIFVGDYIDRGEQSAQVLHRLYALSQVRPGVTCLLGNHEQMMLEFLAAPEEKGPRWVRYGGLQTLASFGLGYISENASAAQWREIAERLTEALGPELRRWLEGRPLIWTSGNVTVVHAAADPQRPLDRQERQTLLWGHPDFEGTPREDGQWIVHGHTIVDQPQARAGRIAIDTGAYATGRLTVALISPDEVLFEQS
ncbi:metallophosphoesterase [Pseudooceanicola sp. 200-1SW]|uniref:metallophosphoesterase n=1 Tax=Pseudooceanicola sp. 200-1SW TaxID=3425949 RepID=UPI003D7F46EE